MKRDWGADGRPMRLSHDKADERPLETPVGETNEETAQGATG